MILLLDTSALVKIYIAEPGSEAIQQRISGQQVALSQLTYAETHATFARRRREGLLTATEHQVLSDRFEGDWEAVLQIPVSNEVLAFIPGLCKNHPLRGADAIQLAACLMLQHQRVQVHFATSDKRLLEAGANEGLTVFDPSA